MKKALLFFVFLLSILNAQSQNYKFGKVSKEELKETAHPQNSEADAAVLYRSVRIYFEFVHDEGFIHKTEVQERIKIYNKQGFAYATKQIPLYDESNSKQEGISRIKAYTYNLEGDKIVEDKLRDDGIFEEKNNKYWKVKKFTMPNVKEGSVIEYTYTVESPFLFIDEIDFQQSIPINKLDFKFSAPEYFNYKTVSNLKASYYPNIKNSTDNKNYTISYTKEAAVGLTSDPETRSRRVSNQMTIKENVISVNEQNIPALVKEPMVDNLDNYRAKIRFELNYIKYPNSPIEGYATTWESVSKKIYDSDDFGGELNKTSYFEDDLDNVLAGESDSYKKIPLILEFVKSKVKWNNLNGIYADVGVKRAYKDGSGNIADINLMLVAMLRHAGFDANPVLVSTKSHGVPIFPTRDGFNYIIGVVQLDGNQVLLDASSKFSSPNILPPKVLNWQGRLIRKDGTSSWVLLSPLEPSKDISMFNFKLDPNDLSASGQFKEQLSDYQAFNYRNEYDNFSNENILEDLQRDYHGLEVSNLNVSNLNNVYEPISQSYDFHINNAMESIGDKLYFSPFLFLADEENPFKSEIRNYPIDFIFLISDKVMINITLPEGYAVESLPESAKVVFNDGDGEFSYLIKQNGAMLQLIMVFNLNKTLIMPEEYKEFKQFFQMFASKQAEQIVLTKV